MKTSLAAICCALAIAGCASSTDNTTTAALTVATDSAVAGQPAVLHEFSPAGADSRSVEIDSVLRGKIGWADALVTRYITLSDNEGVQYAAKDSSITWIWDQLLDTDSAQYLVCHLGHDYEDEDGRRFITDGWLYIDTLTRRLYEYDVPDDSLIMWNK
jgi:hypothetical protein